MGAVASSYIALRLDNPAANNLDNYSSLLLVLGRLLDLIAYIIGYNDAITRQDK